MLDKALAEARISRDEVYITNAVKHFRWIQRGKRRLHQKPAGRQIMACKPWIESEMESIHPKLVVCLGATATQSILGRVVSIGQARGKFLNGQRGEAVFITIHPSADFPAARKKRTRRRIPPVSRRHAASGAQVARYGGCVIFILSRDPRNHFIRASFCVLRAGRPYNI
jgi:uracil-DNA glycosylase family 4